MTRPGLTGSSVIVIFLVGCGSSAGSSFFSRGQGDSSPGPSGQLGDFNGNPGGGFSSACVTSLADAALPPVNLVIMYDKSGSMGDPAEGGNPTLRWIPVNTGMKAFFTDASSSGYAASLQFFPAPGDATATCGAPYATPLVPLTPLSRPDALLHALDAATPYGGTPTLPALAGAITYAERTRQARPSEPTVVVLVTDGEPGMIVGGQFGPGCVDNDIPHVAAAAAAAFAATPSVPTFVIGVGPDVVKLNAVAVAGGTRQAFMIAASDPTATRTQLQSAFDAIRAQVPRSCAFDLPQAPDGQKLDKNQVNVKFTSGAGVDTHLVYSADCSAPDAWHYDNASAPAEIVLCPSACHAIQSDIDSKLQLAFGCQTAGLVK